MDLFHDREVYAAYLVQRKLASSLAIFMSCWCAAQKGVRIPNEQENLENYVLHDFHCIPFQSKLRYYSHKRHQVLNFRSNNAIFPSSSISQTAVKW